MPDAETKLASRLGLLTVLILYLLECKKKEKRKKKVN
jgi:hypothetical protein